MAKLDIQIESRKMLKPSTPTPNHLRTLKLSLFDQLAPRAYVPILFHYLPNNYTTETSCDKLQKSLAETLIANFYPLAGRLREDVLSIHCNDEGVENVQTKVLNSDLVQFLHQKNIEVLNDFLPWPSSSVPPYSDVTSTPLLGVQVNVFSCGGVVIGIQISHKIADAFTLATFVNEWAHICQTGTKTMTNDHFGHLSSLFPTRVLSGPQFSLPSPNTATTTAPNYKVVTRRFVFDPVAIANLKNNTLVDSSDSRRPTRVVVVMSLIWKVLMGIPSAKNLGLSRDSSLLFPINLRGKSNLPSLDDDALGNYTMFGIADLKASPSQSRKELNYFVKLIGNTIRDTCVGIGYKAASIDDISFLVVNNHTKFVDKFVQGDKMDFYLSTSWCGFPWYEADFGWGKSFWVTSLSLDIAFEAIILMDTKNDDGIEAWVTLKENVMAEFERDAHILTFCSQLPK